MSVQFVSCLDLVANIGMSRALWQVDSACAEADSMFARLLFPNETCDAYAISHSGFFLLQPLEVDGMVLCIFELGLHFHFFLTSIRFELCF